MTFDGAPGGMVFNPSQSGGGGGSGGTLHIEAGNIVGSGNLLRATVAPAPEQWERTIEVDAHIRRLHELIDRALSVMSGPSPANAET